MSSRMSTPTPSLRSRASSASSGTSKKGGRRRGRSRALSNVSQSSHYSNSSNGSQDRASVFSEKAAMSMRAKNQFSRITALIKDKNRKKKKDDPSGTNQVAYVDSSRAALSSSLGTKDLRGDILKHRTRLKNEEDAEETDTQGFLLFSEQAEWDIKVFYTFVCKLWDLFSCMFIS